MWSAVHFGHEIHDNTADTVPYQHRVEVLKEGDNTLPPVVQFENSPAGRTKCRVVNIDISNGMKSALTVLGKLSNWPISWFNP